MSKILSSKEPLESYIKPFPKELCAFTSYIGSPYNSYSCKKNPEIEGAKLIVSEDNLCRKIETTIGTYTIRGKEDLEDLLLGRRFLIVGTKSSELSTLYKWYPREVSYYNSQGQPCKTNSSIAPHPIECFISESDTIIKLNPCHCAKDSCPYKDKSSGWIEDVSEVYDLLGGKPNPTLKEIKSIFSSIEETLWEREGLSIKYFTQPGSLAGRLIQTNPRSLINRRDIPEKDRDKWDRSLTLARAGSSLGLSFVRKVTITKEGTHEDVRGSHMSHLFSIPLITPKQVFIREVDGYGLSEESFWYQVRTSVAAVSYGTQSYPDKITPRQHRIPLSRAGKNYVVVPTNHPVTDVVSRPNLLSISEIGKEYYTPIKTYFFFKIDDRKPLETYGSLVSTLEGYLNEKTYFGKYMKYVTKVVAGKLNSYTISRNVRRIGYSTNTFYGVDLLVPSKELPFDYEGEEVREVKLGPAINPIVASEIYAKEEETLRWQISSRSKSGQVLHVCKDSDTFTGPRRKLPSKSKAKFNMKTNLDQEVGTFSDLIYSFSGDGHKVNWLEVAKNTSLNSTILKGPKREHRLGLEAYTNLGLEEAYQILGKVEIIEPVCKLGSQKLLGLEEVKVGDILERGVSYTFPRTLEEIQEIGNNIQSEDWNE